MFYAFVETQNTETPDLQIESPQTRLRLPSVSKEHVVAKEYLKYIFQTYKNTVLDNALIINKIV